MAMMKSIKQVYLELAGSLFSAGRFNEALDAAQKALAEPEEGDMNLQLEALSLAGRACAALGQTSEAIKFFTAAIELDPAAFSSLSSDLEPLAQALSESQNGAFNLFLDHLKAAADKASSANNPALAEAILKWISTWQPQDSSLHLNLSNVLIKQGKTDEGLDLLRKIAGTAPAEQSRLDLGLGFLQSGRFQEALVIFNELLAEDPDSQAVLKQRGIAQRHLGDLDSSLVDLERAVSLNPEDSQALKELAATQALLGKAIQAAETYHQASLAYIRGGDPSEALYCTLQAAALDPQNWQFQYDAGQALNAQDKYQEALPYLNNAAALERNSQVLVELCISHYMLNRYEEALQYADEALRQDSQNILALMYKGSALRLTEKPEEGLKVLEEVIALQPDSSGWCYSEKGAALEALGRDAEALQAYRVSVEINPLSGWAQGRYGRQLRWNDQHEEALLHLDEAIRLYGDEPQPWLLIQKGHCLYDMGRYEEAVRVYDELLAFDPSQAGAARYKGIALSMVGRYSEAVTALQVAIDLDAASGKVEALPYAELGDALRMLDRYREAETALRKALEIQPDYQFAKARLGEVLRSQKLYAQAVELLSEAVRLKEDDYWALAGLGASLYELGNFKSGLESVEKSLQIKPDYDFAKMIKGLILRFSKRWTQALEVYQQLLDANPEDQWTLLETAVALRFQNRENSRQALERVERILKVSPNYLGANAQAAVCRLLLGDYPSALQAAAKELENDPSQIWLHQVECLCYERQGETDKAAQAEELALKDGDYTQSLVDRGNVYSELYDYGRAERDFRQAMREKADNYEAYNMLAWMLAEELKERLGEALSLAERAVSLAQSAEDEQTIALVMDTHAWVLYRLGRRDEALRMLEQALKLSDESLEMHDHLAVMRAGPGG